MMTRSFSTLMLYCCVSKFVDVLIIFFILNDVSGNRDDNRSNNLIQYQLMSCLMFKKKKNFFPVYIVTLLWVNFMLMFECMRYSLIYLILMFVCKCFSEFCGVFFLWLCFVNAVYFLLGRYLHPEYLQLVFLHIISFFEWEKKH